MRHVGKAALGVRSLRVAALLLGVAALGAAALPLSGCDSAAEALGAPSPTVTPAPAWLQEATAKAVGPYSAGPYPASEPRSVDWVLTTVGTYDEVLSGQSPADSAFADKAAYVVFVDGQFTPTHVLDPATAPKGTQLVLAYSGDTQELVTLTILPKPIEPSAFGAVNAMTLKGSH